MFVFYSFSIYLYYVAIWIAQLYNPKAKKWIDGRKNQWTTFPQVKNKKVIWFHCASLGEFDQGAPLMRRIKEENPSIFLLVTFFSPSGMEHYHKRNLSIDYTCYLPIDTKKNAAQFIQHFKPKSCYFIKYEFWFNFINEAKKMVVSYILSVLYSEKIIIFLNGMAVFSDEYLDSSITFLFKIKNR
jgi:3-deoxy-D-manno-octulosonic-acid transferase